MQSNRAFDPELTPEVALEVPLEVLGDPAPLVPAFRAWVSAGGVMALVALTLTVIGVGGGAIGEVLPRRLLILCGVGATLAWGWPGRRVAIASAVGTLALAMVNPTFTAYFLLMVGALMATRRNRAVFLAVLVLAAIVGPKTAFVLHYHQPGYWNWIDEPSLALALFVSALWLRERSRPGASPDGGERLSFFLCYLFPSHATNPMPFAPSLLARERRFDVRPILTLLGWFAAKAVVLYAVRRFGQSALLATAGPAQMAGLGRGQLWGMVMVTYVETCLSLATTADIPVLIARLFGFPLPDPFRFPLLAWNPVELWRRWGIYNRHVLLQLIYFPLGGSHRHKYLNVMLTFLGSALLLHSGWFGSKYWQVGVAGWRDQSIYFLLQGLAVCACLAVWDRRGSSRRLRGTPGLSPGLIAAIACTQAFSALAHVVILAPRISLAQRAHVIARCLGLA